MKTSKQLSSVHQKAYRDHKSNAKRRNIEFNFTYEEWLNFWGSDINKRGTGSLDLQMCRYNDTGAYSPDNVFKATHRENAQQQDNSNYNVVPATLAKHKKVHTDKGIFESVKEAGEYFGFSDVYGTVRNRCLSNNYSNWYYVGETV